jgi:hypothetical protein
MSRMRRFVDLHTHTTASDGSIAPAELVRLADAERLAAVAVTDHDTTDGLTDARASATRFPRLALVPGVEISVAYEPGTMHVLGLGIAEGSTPMRELTDWYRAARRERNPRIIAKLQAMGLPVDMDDVLAVARAPGGRAGTIISRVHIAETLRRKGCVTTTAEAFDRYIGSHAPAYVHKRRRQPADAIAQIRAAGGTAVLAHPVQLRCDGPRQLEQILRQLMDAGLEGIEVYHTDHSDQQTRHYLELARRLGLVVTGGSDLHGLVRSAAKLGRPRVPISVVAEPWASRWFGGP